MNSENKDYKSIVQGYVVKNSRKRKNINNIITVILFSFVVIAIFIVSKVTKSSSNLRE